MNGLFLERAAFEETAPKTVQDLNKRIKELFETDPNLEKEIQIQLGQLVSQTYKSALESSEGYCYKFNLPIVAVQSFFKKIKTSPTMVDDAFRADWKYPRNTHMYSD